MRIPKKLAWFGTVPIFLISLLFLVIGIADGIKWMIIVFSIGVVVYGIAIAILILDKKQKEWMTK